MKATEIGSVFDAWNEGPLKSYLIEISGKVAGATDRATGGALLDVIEDAAGQKGTGRWTAIEAQHLGAPIPVIEAAVAARNMSAQRALRADLANKFEMGISRLSVDILPLGTLEKALICGKVLCYAQGFEMIRAASEMFDWSLDAPQIARIWRAGCIIRSAMLDDMAEALEANPGQNLMAAPFFADILRGSVSDLRAAITAGIAAGLPVPALSAALGYFDTMRQTRGTANMIQGQRDFFGLHGFVRLDTGASDQHGPWADD
jgi:6-phosphogluconate dehydrogenase